MKRLTSHNVKITDLRDLNGELQNDADCSVRVTVKDKDNAQLYQAMMGYVEPGEWQLDLPASIFTAATAPWTVVIEYMDASESVVRVTDTIAATDRYWEI